MITWVIVILLIALAFVFLKMRHIKHKFFAVALILLIIFIYLTVSNIIAENNSDLKSFEGITQVAKLYFSWLGNVFVNLKDIGGNVIKMQWSPENSTLK